MDNQQLLKRIEELEKWKSEKESQQIVFPLDQRSIDVLNRYFMRINSSITYTNSSGDEFTDYIGSQGNQEFIAQRNYYIPYSVNTTTDYVTIQGYIEDDQVINLRTTDTAPGGLSTAASYYAINSTGNTFQLSLTPSPGAAVNITSAGTGRQFLYSFGF